MFASVAASFFSFLKKQQVLMTSSVLQPIKWWLSIFGWLAALASWFQIIIVLGFGREEILNYRWKFFVFIFLWIIIVCSYFNAMFSMAHPIPRQYHIEYCGDIDEHNKKIKRKAETLNVFSVCVHHHNHKFFLLFLLWPCCLGIYVTIMTIPYTIRTANNIWMGGTLSSEHHLLNSAIMNATVGIQSLLVIALSVGSLLKTQVQSLLTNRTTIEDSQLSFLDDDEMNHEFPIFDLGTRLENFRSIFGTSPMKWFLPVYTTPGDGINYIYVVRFGKDVANQAKPQRRRRFFIC
ncbi:hypothetical protein DICVIV_05763 [Dictyocaulus viviparus]|uniref:Palmitoyltransferase n=1 Tax=Dictyocaulus viviparus TaxID=29172 RepID=A0A0D8XWI6_DICVI|nr:hypothetical protein DICVIV_05763 [Dictyocaulus viviparus]